MSNSNEKKSLSIRKIGRIGQIISTVVLLILFTLAVEYQNISNGMFIIGIGVFFVAMMGIVISTMCVVLGLDTEKYIASKKILDHFGVLDDLND